MSKEQEKKCFIVTPIGSDTDPIRRHIEGIIEAAIRPALGGKYELVVAHKIYEPGSITKQVIAEIYNATLVIANLTNRNPNVMYELAFRHSLGMPAIMIAESGTSLPSDIIMERVIFYHNDAQGVLDLKEALVKAENEIDFSKIGSPIYDVLHSIDRDISILQISQNETQPKQEVLPYILEKLNKLEDMFLANKSSNNTPSTSPCNWEIHFSLSATSEKDFSSIIKEVLHKVFFADPTINICYYDYSPYDVTVSFFAPADYSSNILKFIFERAFFDAGFKDVTCTKISRA